MKLSLRSIDKRLFIFPFLPLNSFAYMSLLSISLLLSSSSSSTAMTKYWKGCCHERVELWVRIKMYFERLCVMHRTIRSNRKYISAWKSSVYSRREKDSFFLRILFDSYKYNGALVKWKFFIVMNKKGKLALIQSLIHVDV